MIPINGYFLATLWIERITPGPMLTWSQFHASLPVAVSFLLATGGATPIFWVGQTSTAHTVDYISFDTQQ